MKNEISDIEQFSPLLIGLLLLVILCFIWKPVVNKQPHQKKQTSTTEADMFNLLQVGVYVIH